MLRAPTLSVNNFPRLKQTFKNHKKKTFCLDDSLLSFSWTADPSVLAGFTVYNNSITLGMHGSPKQWIGNICFNDNHVEFLESFYPEGVQYRYRNSSRPDNVFREDLPDDGADQDEATDIWLTFTLEVSDDGGGDSTATIQWD